LLTYSKRSPRWPFFMGVVTALCATGWILHDKFLEGWSVNNLLHCIHVIQLRSRYFKDVLVCF
jgi:hypothetical protein